MEVVRTMIKTSKNNLLKAIIGSATTDYKIKNRDNLSSHQSITSRSKLSSR